MSHFLGLKLGLLLQVASTTDRYHVVKFIGTASFDAPPGLCSVFGYSNQKP